MNPTITIRLQREPFDAAAEADKLTRGRTDVGAVVSFTGVCRGNEDGEPIEALTLEHYPNMAEAEIERHVTEACTRWPLFGATVVHRYGRIRPRAAIRAPICIISPRRTKSWARCCCRRSTSPTTKP